MKQRLKQQFWWLSLSAIICVTNLSLDRSLAVADTSPPPGKNNGSSIPLASARELFRQAYDNRYTWDSKFPGYAADVELKLGKERYIGQIRVTAQLGVEVTGIDDKDANENVKNQILMLVVHRRQTSFETAHGINNFRILSTDGKGRTEISQQGKSEARYKVFENKIAQVNRILGDIGVTVDLLESQQTPEGYLATRYKTIFWQPASRKVVGSMEQKDSYEKIGGYYIPRQVVTRETDELGQQRAAEFDFTNIRLLQ